MTFFRKLFASARPEPRFNEIQPSFAGGYAAGGDLDFYYAMLRDDRPGVRAMREVAADLGRHF